LDWHLDTGLPNTCNIIR